MSAVNSMGEPAHNPLVAAGMSPVPIGRHHAALRTLTGVRRSQRSLAAVAGPAALILGAMAAIVASAVLVATQLLDPSDARESGAGVELTTEPSSPATTPAAPDSVGGSSSASSSVVTGPAPPAEIVRYDVRVIERHPHDPSAFTQGLEVVGDGLVVESTGIEGASSIRLVDVATGEPRLLVPLDGDLFGEGATIVDDEVWQLTWDDEVALVHDLEGLTEERRVPYEGIGWGLCAEADRLVMSDGSSRLTFRDRATFDVIGSVDVTADGEPVANLNELECIDGLVWANVYRTTQLVAIDPGDGRVVGLADIADLVPPDFVGDLTNVANGIAHDPDTGRFLLTGKRWPVLYEVELLPAP